VLAHVDKAGFHLNPSLNECEMALQNPDLTAMAMGALASGFFTPNEACEYVNKIKSVKAVVVGASSKAHIEDTFHRIRTK
jgi:hypothetical protein